MAGDATGAVDFEPPDPVLPPRDGMNGVAVPCIIGFSLLIGLALRALLFPIGAKHSFYWDHVDYVRWGALASREGVNALYVKKPPRLTHESVRADGSRETRPIKYMRRRFNYPPAAAHLHWLLGTIHRSLDENQTSNTTTARLVYAALPVCCDILTAIGAGLIIAGFAGRLSGAIGFAITILAPPMAFESAFWTQTDSWVAAAAVWMLLAMLRGRWYWAGLLWGIALGLKPQGLFFAPLWLFALWTCRPRFRVLLAGLSAVMVLNIIAIPFWYNSGDAWLRRAYVANMSQNHAKTSLTAFNLWYVDQLLTENRDAAAVVLGAGKDQWGKLLATTGILIAAVIARRRFAPQPSLAVFAALSLIAILMLSTRVHERYLCVALPFVIVTAFLVPRTWPVVALLILAQCFQITAHNWGGVELAGKGLRAKSFEVVRRFQSQPGPKSAADDATSEKSRSTYNRIRSRHILCEWTLVCVMLSAASAMFIVAGRNGRRPLEPHRRRAAHAASV